MREVQDILVGLLRDFPDSGLADRIQRNLEAVEVQLDKEG